MQLWVRVVARGAGTFDPWKKHDKFFRLREGDNDGLLSFLNSVGFLDAPFPELENSRSWTGRLPDGNIYTANYAPWTEVREVWAMRRLMQNSLKKLRSFSGKHSDFTVRILTVRGKVKAVITTTTFLQALELTLSVDRLRGSRVQKCARPDCGITFTIATSHEKKFCSWYCGHIESVRKKRKEAD